MGKRLARDCPNTFLQAFFDKKGRDTNATPVELQNLADANRAHLHIAAGSLRLYHETAITAMGPILVIGSGKNGLGQRRVQKLNKAFDRQFPTSQLLAEIEYHRTGGRYNLNRDVEDGEDEEEDSDEDSDEEIESKYWDIYGS